MLGYKNGFTLIELLVVLFLIALGSSLVFLNVTINKNLNKDEQFLEKFVKLIENVKVQSIVENKVGRIIIDGDTRDIIYGKKKIHIPEDITITAEKIFEENGKYLIIFYPDGTSSGANLNIISKKFKKKMIINKFSTKVILKDET